MGLRLKEGINPEVLRDFGFHLGKEDFGKERWCGYGIGYQQQANWYHKFLMFDEETGELNTSSGKIMYTGEEFDIPMVQMTFRIGNGNDLYIDCAPSYTYHIGGSDLDIVAETIFALTQAGLLEIDKEA